MHDLWQSALNQFRTQFNNQDFDAWIRPIVCTEVSDQEIHLEVPHAFFEEWIRDRYLDTIEETLSALRQRPCTVAFSHRADSRRAEEAPQAPIQQSLSLGAAKSHLPAVAPPVVTPARRELAPAELLEDYLFDTFVVGPSNQFSHAACQAVASSPARNYNPLFIYGGVGLGKTHLLHAIGHEVHRRDPSMRVKYISSESYINELIQCIRLDRMDEFRYRYRSECDVLLIDDIQFIAGKDRTQEEFFHTFNSLYSSHKQIVVTSDKVPSELPGLEERLRTRFQWGLIADIQPPEIETRVAILEKKARREGLELPDDLAMYLATHMQSNVRELEGSLIRVNAYASLTHSQVNLDTAKRVLKDLFVEHSERITEDRIIKDVCAYFGVKSTDIKGPRRHKVISLPRMVAMYLCRKYTDASFPEIGRKFGGRDHSTVMNSVSKVERLLGTEPQVAKAVRSLERTY